MSYFYSGDELRDLTLEESDDPGDAYKYLG